MINDKKLHEELRHLWQSLKPREINSNTKIVINSKSIHDVDISKLRTTYETHDYVILKFENEVTLADVACLLELFGLSSAYIPDYYRESGVQYDYGFNRIGKDVDFEHSGFSSCSAQEFHSDGTLMSLGAIRTSVLFCKHRASSGGESLVFHTCRALLDAIFSHEMELGFLLEKSCLSRTAVDLDS